MKKILRFASALLCGAMLLCSLSVTAFAENDDEVYDFDPNTDKIYSEAVYMVNTDTGDAAILGHAHETVGKFLHLLFEIRIALCQFLVHLGK